MAVCGEIWFNFEDFAKLEGFIEDKYMLYDSLEQITPWTKSEKVQYKTFKIRESWFMLAHLSAGPTVVIVSFK